MRNLSGGGAALLAILALPAFAQDAPEVAVVVAPAQALVIPSVQPPAANPVLQTGTEVQLTLLQELTTRNKRLRVGDRFRLETSEPILVDGATVIPVGTPAVGEITEVRNKGMWGRSGRFVGRLLYLNVNGRRIRLGGDFDDKGKAGGAGAVAVSAIVFLPAGFFMTGTSALLPAGTEIKGFIDEDVPLAVQAVAPATAAPMPATLSTVALVPAPLAPSVQPEAPVPLAPPRPGNSRVTCTTCR